MNPIASYLHVRHSHHAIAVLTVILACSAASTAQAQGLPLVFPSDKVKVIIGKGDSFDLRAHSGRMTIMEFRDTIKRAYSMSPSYYVKQRGDHRVDLKLKRNHPAEVTTVVIETADEHAINVGVVPTEEPIQVPKYIEVETLTRAQLEERKRNQRTTSQLLHRHEWLTVNRHPDSDAPLHAEILGLTTLNERQDDGSIKTKRFLKFCVDNRTSRSYPLATIMIVDDNREHLRAQAVAFDAPGDTQRGFLLATIPAKTRVQGAVMVPHALQGSLHELSLTFSDPAGIRPLIATTEKADWVLLRNKDYEREQRELSLARRELLLARQVAFGVHALGGAIWMANPQNTDANAPATITGFGIRGTYGIHTLFAVEGEFAAARTGNAYFDDTWNGVEGELARRATVVRFLFSGVLRMGRRYVPTLRIGLGFQGANHTASFVSNDGVMMNGPNDDFEAKLLLSLGAGFNARIGDHLYLGVHAGFSQSIDAESTSLEGGLHLSYGWNPGNQGIR